MAITFDDLKRANNSRAISWNAGKPEPGIEFRALEMAGECGEACNEAKKIARSHRGMAGGHNDHAQLLDELADVVICADLVAREIGGDLGEAVRRKFNKTSEKHGFSERIQHQESDSHEN